MMSFAGIDLPVTTPALAAWVEATIPPREVYEFNPTYDSNAASSIPAPPIYEPPPVRTGVLYWPTGASRWAVFHTVLTGDQLVSLRAVLAEGQGNGGYKAADLVLDDGKRTLTTEMFMLPPKPLSGWYREGAATPTLEDDDYREANDLWLVTLVDARFYWWFRQGVPSNSGWKTMVEGMLTFLGETATVPSDFGQDYPSPKTRWVAHGRPVPVSLDAACAAVGRKLVRKLDGTLEFQTWEQARDAAKNFLVRQYAEEAGSVEYPTSLSAEDFARVAGGIMDYEDLRRNVPQKVRVYYADDQQSEVTLATLAIPEYLTFTGRTNEAAVVRIDDLAPGETGSLATFVNRAAKDWYGWQLANVDLVLGGIAGWDSCGWQEAVRWSANGPPSTRIVKPPYGIGAALGLNPPPSSGGGGDPAETWEIGIIVGVNTSVSPPSYSIVKGAVDPGNGNFAPFDANVLSPAYRVYPQAPLAQYSPLRNGDPVLYRRNPANNSVFDLTPWQASVRFVEYEYVETDAFDVATCQMVQNRKRVKLWIPGGHAEFLAGTGGSNSVTP